MNLLGLLLLMALVLAVFFVVTYTVRAVGALERIEQRLEQLVEARDRRPS